MFFKTFQVSSNIYWLDVKQHLVQRGCLWNREGQELSTRDMQKLVQALPQYRDQIDKLSLHIHVSQTGDLQTSECWKSDLDTKEAHIMAARK